MQHELREERAFPPDMRVQHTGCVVGELAGLGIHRNVVVSVRNSASERTFSGFAVEQKRARSNADHHDVSIPRMN